MKWQHHVAGFSFDQIVALRQMCSDAGVHIFISGAELKHDWEVRKKEKGRSPRVEISDIEFYVTISHWGLFPLTWAQAWKVLNDGKGKNTKEARKKRVELIKVKGNFDPYDG